MGCQKSIASKIIEKGGDYVIALKGNQPAIHDEVINYFDQARAIAFEGVPVDHHGSLDKGHGRIEERDVYGTSEIDWLPMGEEWPKLQSIVMVHSRRSLEGKTTEEFRYYLASLKPDAMKLSQYCRGHWGIENRVHWVLDVTFQEDGSQISTGNAPENLSILRRLGLNILKLDPDKKTSLRAKRMKAGWDNAFLVHLLGLAAVNNF